VQFIAILIVAPLVVKYWWLIVGTIGVIVAVTRIKGAVDRHAERVEAERRRLGEIATPADQQHRWAMEGDEHGIYANIRLPQCDSIPRLPTV